ncbi:MFS transporter [Bounagaea algeriensis]
MSTSSEAYPPWRGEHTHGAPWRAVMCAAARVRLVTVLFLCAYWIYTDGIATVTQGAAQYGAVELRLAREPLFAALLIVQGSEAFICGICQHVLS